MKRHTRKTIKTLLTAGALALTVLLLAGLPGLGCHMDSLYLEEIEEKVAADEEGARSYTIGYFGNNSTSGSVPVDSAQYHQGDTVEVLGNTGNLERTNYTFDGWNTQEDGEGNRRDPGSTFLMGKDNVHLFAQWTINTPTVTFMAQGGSTPIPATKIVTYGELYSSLATTTRTGYSFDGWYDASSGGNEITSGSTVTKNIDHALYARWSLITYNINYYINGGTNHSSNPSNYSVETSTIVLNAPSREGYQFGGVV